MGELQSFSWLLLSPLASSDLWVGAHTLPCCGVLWWCVVVSCCRSLPWSLGGMFWLVCLTTVTAMASFPIYRYLGPIIRSSSLALCAKWGHQIRLLSTGSDRSGSDKSTTANRVYTRTGDNGTTGLFSGERRPKDDVIFEALGTTDELTSAIGLAREFVADRVIRRELEQIQCILQDLQATIATPKSSSNEFQIRRTKWNINHLVDLETWIDRHSEHLPPLRNFILPSGGKAASSLHLARSICRRAERRLVPLLDEGLELPVLQYLNRLSSYLFTAARYCSKADGYQETVYRRPRHQSTDDDDGGEQE